MLVRPKGYCPTCGERKAYDLKSVQKETSFYGISFIFEDVEARCKKCGNLIKVPALEDRNWYEMHKAYYNKLHETFKENTDEYKRSIF